MIAILDYGMGNVASIKNMFRKIGGEAMIVSSLRGQDGLTGVVLPGVGAFDNAMEKLGELGLIDELNDFVLARKMPFLGVCLGMQLLFESSEEGRQPGLGFIRGAVRRFSGSDFLDRKLKIPHMGWNSISPRKNAWLSRETDDEQRFYFAHSYHVVCIDDADVSATCHYGYDFTCAIQHENIFATQFHPEKSHRFGLGVFNSFMSMTC
jgi:glutamine amidotransferase